MSSTVKAASIASFIRDPRRMEPLRSMMMTKFFLTGDAVSTYHALKSKTKFRNKFTLPLECLKRVPEWLLRGKVSKYHALP